MKDSRKNELFCIRLEQRMGFCMLFEALVSPLGELYISFLPQQNHLAAHRLSIE
jgi:hypothetical protein